MRELTVEECDSVGGGLQDSGYQDSGGGPWVGGDGGGSGGTVPPGSGEQDAGSLATHGSIAGIQLGVMQMLGDQLSVFFSDLQSNVQQYSQLGGSDQSSGGVNDLEDYSPMDPEFLSFITQYGSSFQLDRSPSAHYWDYLSQGTDPEFKAEAFADGMMANYSLGVMEVTNYNSGSSANFDGDTASFNMNGFHLIGTFHAGDPTHYGSNIDPLTGLPDIVVSGNHWSFRLDPFYYSGSSISSLFENPVIGGVQAIIDNGYPATNARGEQLAPYLNQPHMNLGETRHLTDSEQNALKLFFGSLITGSELNDVVLKAGGAFGSAAATTWSSTNISFDPKVAIRDYSTNNLTMALLIHEFQHVLQWSGGYGIFRFAANELEGKMTDIYSYNMRQINNLVSGATDFENLNVETQAAIREDYFRSMHGLPLLGNSDFTPTTDELKAAADMQFLPGYHMGA